MKMLNGLKNKYMALEEQEKAGQKKDQFRGKKEENKPTIHEELYL